MFDTRAMQKMIDGLETTDEVRQVDRLLRARWDYLTAQARDQFRPGDAVSWTGKTGTWEGEVTRILQKNVEVRTPDTRVWRVSPTLLRRKG